jgi:hypothetical protein
MSADEPFVVTLDLSDHDDYFVIIEALSQFADRQRSEARFAGPNEAFRIRLAYTAEALRDRIEAETDHSPESPIDPP